MNEEAGDGGTSPASEKNPTPDATGETFQLK